MGSPFGRLVFREIGHRRFSGNVGWSNPRSERTADALELGAAVIGGGRAGFDYGLDLLQPSRLAIGLALPLLAGDGDIMFGLPRR